MAEIVNIYNELKELGCNSLINLERKNIFTYPEAYFDDLHANISRNIWFQSFSPIMLYTVPEGYFENFPQLMLDKLSVQFDYSLPGKSTLYQLPDNYFDSLAANILQKIKIEKVDNVQKELEDISPLLSKIPKSNIYTVPDGYFEKGITIQHKQPVKVISLAGKSHKLFRYAAAACIAAVISFGGYFYIINKPLTSSVQNQIANINVNKAISQLPDSTLNDYLTNDNSDIYASQSSDEDLNIQNLINNTSDQDIEDYLKQNPGIDDDTKGS